MDGTISFGNDISNDDGPSNADLFDDDPFNLPPPLPALDDDLDLDIQNGAGIAGDAEAANTQPNGEPAQKKKRTVRKSPRPKLDEGRLCSDRGLPALLHVCDNVKFRGKGHEASDLKVLLRCYEHWAHRLFPKFPFDAVVEQAEHLGGKKLVQNTMKSLRRGEDGLVRDDLVSGEEDNPSGDVPADPSTVVDQSEMMEDFGGQVATENVVTITADVQERIQLNRERALAKRRAAMEALANREGEQMLDQTPTSGAEQMEEHMNGQADHETVPCDENVTGQLNENVTGQMKDHVTGELEDHVTGVGQHLTGQIDKDIAGEVEKHVAEQTDEGMQGEMNEYTTQQPDTSVTGGTETHATRQPEENMTPGTEMHVEVPTEEPVARQLDDYVTAEVDEHVPEPSDGTGEPGRLATGQTDDQVTGGVEEHATESTEAQLAERQTRSHEIENSEDHTVEQRADHETEHAPMEE